MYSKMDFLMQTNTSNSTITQQSKEEGVDKGQVHGLMMMVAFIGLLTIGIWALAFKHHKCALYIHLLCMSIATILVWMGAFLLIISQGINAEIGAFHIWFGISITVITFVQCVTGLIAWINQKSSKIAPKQIYILNWIHRIPGIILYIAGAVQILYIQNKQQTIFRTVLVISAFSLVFYLLYSIFNKKMNVRSAMQQGYKQKLLSVSSSQDLAKIKDQYFIFADKVYDFHNVLGNHPGGYEVIRAIKGREIDRYIYGTQPLEIFNNKMYLHYHTSRSLTLAGSPIGIIKSINPYISMFDTNQCHVSTLKKLNSPSMYIPYLASQNTLQPFIYNGYTNLSQFGKYFTVTIRHNITRLYSVVNFLNLDNLQLMEEIMGISILDTWVYSKQQKGLGGQSTQRGFQRKISSNVIPLLMKKYAYSNFTSQFLDGVYKGKVTISKSLGRGLFLHQIPVGQLIFFGAGTGINPFCDLIDIAYKQQILTRSPKNAQQIISQNPILKNKNIILNKYKITIFYSVHNCQQLNQITSFQLNQLSKDKIINVYVRGTQNTTQFFSKYKNISRIQNYFQNYVEQIANNLIAISQIYVCGPPGMVGKLVEAFQDNKIPSFRYSIL